MRIRSTTIIFLTLVLIGNLISGCSPSPEELAPTNTPIPSETLSPTKTTVPSATSQPTATNTPSPTNTPTIRPTFSPETLNLAAGDPLKIGYLLWETHEWGIDSFRGIEIALSDFGGEIFGHPIELVGYDTDCNEFAGIRGSQILMEDETIIGIIGTTCSGAGLQAAPIVSENNRVMISPSNTSPELTAADTHYGGYFRTAPNDLVQIEAVAQYAFDELDARRLAVVRGATNLYERLYSSALCEVFTDLGGECVLDKAKDSGSTYVAPIISSLAEADPDAIYFMSMDYQEGAAFLSEARKNPDLEGTALLVWGEGYNNSGFLEQAGEDATGVYISVTSYDIDRDSDNYHTFLLAYYKEYSEEPVSFFHPYAYDAATLLLKAIEQVAVPEEDGSLMVDPMAVRDALNGKIEFQGLSGYISCSGFGDCLTAANGRVFQFTSGDPSTYNPGPADFTDANPIQVWP